jgi:hypothetical protein
VSGRKHRRKIAQAADALKLGGAELAEVARGDIRMVLQQDGKDVVALISAADLERLEYLELLRAQRYKAIEEIQSRNADKDPEEVERDVAEAVAEVRAEARARREAASRT